MEGQLDLFLDIAAPAVPVVSGECCLNSETENDNQFVLHAIEYGYWNDVEALSEYRAELFMKIKDAQMLHDCKSGLHPEESEMRRALKQIRQRLDALIQ